jgi:hypothetical protein
VTLQEFANYANILGALSVVGGVGFGLVQLTECRKQRRDVIAAELMRSNPCGRRIAASYPRAAPGANCGNACGPKDPIGSSANSTRMFDCDSDCHCAWVINHFRTNSVTVLRASSR